MPAAAAASFDVAPYFDDLLARLAAGDPDATAAFGRHVHWGYWPDPAAATGTAADYAAAAERLCRIVCDAAGVRDGMRVLDVGCGLGGTVASLDERFTGMDLLGVNLDPRQVAWASEKVTGRPGNRVRFMVGDACALDVPAGAFDAVLAVECVFHFPSRADFLRGAAAALKPGGTLALSDFVPPASAVEALAKYDPAADAATRATYGRIDVNCPVESYRALAAAAGLELLGTQDITAGTLPTYGFLQSDFRGRPDKRTARVHGKATARLEAACRLDVLTYTVLAFRKRG